MPDAAIKAFGFALGPAEGGAVVIGGAGNRDVDETDRPAAVADRPQQPLDEIAMHIAGVAARAVLQHAEAIDYDIDVVIPDQPRQRGRIHRHHGHFQIERAVSFARTQIAARSRSRESPARADRR